MTSSVKVSDLAHTSLIECRVEITGPEMDREFRAWCAERSLKVYETTRNNPWFAPAGMTRGQLARFTSFWFDGEKRTLLVMTRSDVRAMEIKLRWG